MIKKRVLAPLSVVVCAVVFAVLPLALAQSAALPERSSPTRPATSIDDAFVDRVIAAIKRHRLTALPIEQLSFQKLGEVRPGIRMMNVRENHKNAGAPETSPRLFSFCLDTKTNILTTDALNLDGEFKPVAE